MNTRKIVYKWINSLMVENNVETPEDLSYEVLDNSIKEARKVIENDEGLSNEFKLCYIFYANHLECIKRSKQSVERTILETKFERPKRREWY